MGNILGTSKNKLKSENELLKIEKKRLQDQLKQLHSSERNDNLNKLEDNMKESIKLIVDDILKNNNINSALIPDFIERKIYTNIFNILINLLKELLESSKISILNQKITFMLESDV